MSFFARTSRITLRALQSAPAAPSFSTSVRVHKSATETAKDTLKAVDRTIANAAVKGIEKGRTLFVSRNLFSPTPSLPAPLPARPLADVAPPTDLEEASAAARDTLNIHAAKAEGAAQEATGDAKGTAHGLAGQAQEYAGRAKGKAHELAGEAKGKAQEVKGEVVGKAQEVKGEAVGKKEELKSKI